MYPAFLYMQLSRVGLLGLPGIPLLSCGGLRVCPASQNVFSVLGASRSYRASHLDISQASWCTRLPYQAAQSCRPPGTARLPAAAFRRPLGGRGLQKHAAQSCESPGASGHLCFFIFKPLDASGLQQLASLSGFSVWPSVPPLHLAGLRVYPISQIKQLSRAGFPLHLGLLLLHFAGLQVHSVSKSGSTVLRVFRVCLGFPSRLNIDFRTHVTFWNPFYVSHKPPKPSNLLKQCADAACVVFLMICMISDLFKFFCYISCSSPLFGFCTATSSASS